MPFAGLPNAPFHYIARDFDNFFRIQFNEQDAKKTDDYFILTTGLPHGISNLINIRKGSDTSFVDKLVRPRSIAEFPTAVAILEPPSDEVDRLMLELGFLHRETIHAMAADLDDLPMLEEATEFELREIGPEDHSMWVDVMSEGYELPREFVERIGPAADGIIESPGNVTFRFFLAFDNGVPSSTSTHMITDGLLAIYDVSTKPSQRGKGLGRFVTLAPLIKLRAEGHRTAILQASEMGAPIYEKLGFQSTGTFPLYFNEPSGDR